LLDPAPSPRDNSFLNQMNLRHHLGSLRRSVLCSLYRRTVLSGNSGPVVSFTFDDFPRTAYSVGGRILEKFGARGTYYVAAGLMSVSNDLGEMFAVDDLRCLVESGHELGTQTFHHSSAREVSLAAFVDDVQEGMKAMEQMGVRNSTNFAYPYGHATLRSKKNLGPVFTSSRSVIPGLNGPEVDLNLLLANRLYGDIDIDQRQLTEDLILQNEKQKSWLIFYTHDVRPNPSEYGCTPALMEYAVARAARGGSRILTVGEAVAELGIQGVHPKGALEHV
jgi:peptidoglycan/xylan/chitin deacetylase (PgdA/CDA1 family)